MPKSNHTNTDYHSFTQGSREDNTLRMKLSHEYITLRKIAYLTGIPYNLILNAAKQPMLGVPYDVSQTNCSAIEQLLIQSFENPEIDWDRLVLETQPDISPQLQTLPINMADRGYPVGTIITIDEPPRKESWVIVYTNEYHTCIQERGGTRLRVMRNSVLFNRIKSRFYHIDTNLSTSND